MDESSRDTALDYGRLAVHLAAIFAVILLGVFVFWLALSTVKATPFDADGTRCYAKALTMTCLKTATP